MPRIVSIARRRPIRSSSVRWSDTVAGSSGAVSVAIRPFRMVRRALRDLPSARLLIRPPRAGSPRPGTASRPKVTLRRDAPTPAALRVAVALAPALADARGVAVARVLRPDAARRAGHLAAPALRRRAPRAARRHPPRRLREPAP